MEPLCLPNEMTLAIVGIVSTGVMWGSRYFIGWVNRQSGVRKMFLSLLAAPQLVAFLGDLVPGVQVANITDLSTSGVAVPFAAGLVSMAVWAVSKELMKMA